MKTWVGIAVIAVIVGWFGLGLWFEPVSRWVREYRERRLVAKVRALGEVEREEIEAKVAELPEARSFFELPFELLPPLPASCHRWLSPDQIAELQSEYTLPPAPNPKELA